MAVIDAVSNIMQLLCYFNECKLPFAGTWPVLSQGKPLMMDQVNGDVGNPATLLVVDGCRPPSPCWRGAGWEGSPMLAWCWMGGFAYAGVALVGRVCLCWRGAGMASWGWLGAGVAMRWSDFALLSKRTEAFG